MYVFIHGGVNCLNSVPFRCYIGNCHWFNWAPFWTAAACLSSACSFAVSQASDLALLWVCSVYKRTSTLLLISSNAYSFLAQEICGCR